MPPSVCVGAPVGDVEPGDERVGEGLPVAPAVAVPPPPAAVIEGEGVPPPVGAGEGEGAAPVAEGMGVPVPPPEGSGDGVGVKERDAVGEVEGGAEREGVAVLFAGESDEEGEKDAREPVAKPVAVAAGVVVPAPSAAVRVMEGGWR